MKKFLLTSLITLTLYAPMLTAQPGTWTWLKGDPIFNSAYLGTYGTQGVPAASNQPPFFYEAPSLTDTSGNLFLIGGGNGNGQWSDVWRYNTTTNEWTWMKGTGAAFATGVFGVKGVSSPANQPPDISLGSSYDQDKNGMMFIYGGSVNISNNLWLYNPYINEWTWLNGSGNAVFTLPVYGVMGVPSPLNNPGGRTEGLPSWCDSLGNFWLYGGSGQGILGDLWKYDVGLQQWAWMGGTTNNISPPVYGTKNVSSPTNYPGVRGFCSRWKTTPNTFWLGNGSTVSGPANDIWRFDVNTNMWTWEGGSSNGNANVYYGTKCTTSPLVQPYGESEVKACWVYCDNLYAISASTNAVTAFNSVTKNFTWIAGTLSNNPPGVYGTMGVPSTSNICASKFGGAAWYKHPYVYIYSGIYGGTDMMRFEPDTSCGEYLNGCQQNISVLSVNFASSDTILCEKNAVDFTDLSGGSPSQWQWYFPGAVPDTSTLQNPQGIYYANYGTYPVTLVISNGLATDSLTINVFIQVVPKPLKPIVTVNGNILCSTPATYYQWYYNSNIIANAISQCYTASLLGSYYVIVTDTNGCQNTSDLVVLSGIENGYNAETFNLLPQPATDEVQLQLTGNNYGPLLITITDLLGRIVYSHGYYKQSHYFETTLDIKSFLTGTYMVSVTSDNESFIRRLVKN